MVQVWVTLMATTSPAKAAVVVESKYGIPPASPPTVSAEVKDDVPLIKSETKEGPPMPPASSSTPPTQAQPASHDPGRGSDDDFAKSVIWLTMEHMKLKGKYSELEERYNQLYASYAALYAEAQRPRFAYAPIPLGKIQQLHKSRPHNRWEEEEAPFYP